MEDLNKIIENIRKDYKSDHLNEQKAHQDPVKQFGIWMEQAIKASVNEPNAMTLATSTENGRPSSRIVLLRGFGQEGFSFYTNYDSKKGLELLKNPYASLNFFWPELEKQIRIEGTAEKLSLKESDDYFASRPKESQIGAWTSFQSKVLKNREELELRFEELSKKYKDLPVPRPPHWGGFIIKPFYFEFWQGGAHRLHDRIAYTLDNTVWKLERLSP